MGPGQALGRELGPARRALGGRAEGVGEVLRGRRAGRRRVAGLGGLRARAARRRERLGGLVRPRPQGRGVVGGLPVGLRGGARAGRARGPAGGLHVVLERPRAVGGARLALERPRPAPHLAGEVARPVELLGHPRQLLLGAAAAALGDRDARGGVHHRPALDRRARAERLHLPLPDDRQRVGAEAPGRERLLHVEQAAGLAVEAVVGVAGPREPAGAPRARRGRGRPGRAARPPGPPRRPARPSAAGRPSTSTSAIPPARSRPARCSPSAQMTASARLLLPEPFGPDDDVDAGPELERDRVGEGLEALQAEAAQHAGPPSARSASGRGRLLGGLLGGPGALPQRPRRRRGPAW